MRGHWAHGSLAETADFLSRNFGISDAEAKALLMSIGGNHAVLELPTGAGKSRLDGRGRSTASVLISRGAR